MKLQEIVDAAKKGNVLQLLNMGFYTISFHKMPYGYETTMQGWYDEIAPKIDKDDLKKFVYTKEEYWHDITIDKVEITLCVRELFQIPSTQEEVCQALSEQLSKKVK